jgi:hypothetical protein
VSADVNATVNKNPAITMRDNNKDLFLMLLNDIFSTPYLGPQFSKPFWIQTGNNNISNFVTSDFLESSEVLSGRYNCASAPMIPCPNLHVRCANQGRQHLSEIGKL